MTDSVKKFFPLYRFGWAFLLTWVFSVFYTNGIEGYTGSMAIKSGAYDFPHQIFFLGCPVLFSVLTLVAVVLLEKRRGSPIDRQRMIVAAPFITAIGTAFLFIQGDNLAVTMLIFGIASILTGIGSGLLWVMWGEYYAKVSQEEVEFLAPISTAAAAVLVLLISSMAGWVTVVVVSILPVLSGACLLFSWRDTKEQGALSEYSGGREKQEYEKNRTYAAAHPGRAFRILNRTGIGIMITCFFVCMLGTFFLIDSDDTMLFQVAVILSIIFMTIISVVSSRGPQRVSAGFLFRWMCPLLVFGFGATILWEGEWGGYFAYIVSLAARFSFCVITQMFFAHYAACGRTTAVQAYGFGWIFVHLGDFFAVLSTVILEFTLLGSGIASYQIAVVSIILITTLTMFILNKPDSFSVENALEQKQEEAEKEPSSTTNELEKQVRTLAKKHGLTPREVEVFELLARGRSVPFIRDQLVISRDTAATHVKHIYTKLGVHSRQELIDLMQK